MCLSARQSVSLLWSCKSSLESQLYKHLVPSGLKTGATEVQTDSFANTTLETP